MLDCAPSVLRPFGYEIVDWFLRHCLMSRSKLDFSIIVLISRSSFVSYLWLLCFHRLLSNAYLGPSNVIMTHIFCNILVRHCYYLVGSTSRLTISWHLHIIWPEAAELGRITCVCFFPCWFFFRCEQYHWSISRPKKESHEHNKTHECPKHSIAGQTTREILIETFIETWLARYWDFIEESRLSCMSTISLDHTDVTILTA